MQFLKWAGATRGVVKLPAFPGGKGAGRACEAQSGLPVGCGASGRAVTQLFRTFFVT